jgi:hypothetical protein
MEGRNEEVHAICCNLALLGATRRKNSKISKIISNFSRLRIASASIDHIP